MIAVPKSGSSGRSPIPPLKPARSRVGLGDFQTPPGLVDEVLNALEPGLSEGRWGRILEPTCGLGHFLEGAGARLNGRSELVGIEIQDELLARAGGRLGGCPWAVGLRLIREDLFAFDLRSLAWANPGPLLVLGNLPWVTTAALGSIGEANRPAHDDVRSESMTGLSAKTGASNFDISEYLLLKILSELGGGPLTLAMLCKSSVGRKVWAEAIKSGRPVRSASLRRIDARRWFQAAVDASLFLMELGEGAVSRDLRVYPQLSSEEPERIVGLTPRYRLVSDAVVYEGLSDVDGACPLLWRQGVKHDAAPVLELSDDGGIWRNGLGEAVEVEENHLFPLTKSADLLHPNRPPPRRAIVLPQLGLSGIRARHDPEACLLDAYLGRHVERFRARRSSIYRGRPDFAIFGIGPYSFAPWKVAVSGLGKRPVFVPLGPVGGRPMMLDDTSYFVPCRDAEQATIVGATLNHEVSREFLGSLIFPDAKRPVTRGLLERLDLARIAEREGRDRLGPVARECLARLDPAAARQAAGRDLAWSAALVDDWRPGARADLRGT